MDTTLPPPHVLQAFKIPPSTATPHHFLSGQGQSILINNTIVLKPIEPVAVEEAEYIAGLQAWLCDNNNSANTGRREYQVARPIPCTTTTATTTTTTTTTTTATTTTTTTTEPSKPRDGKGGGREYIYHGWTATHVLPGTPGPIGHWHHMLRACRAFHADLRDVSKPGDLLVRRQHQWARGDRVAWEEEDDAEGGIIIAPVLRGSFERLKVLRRPVEIVDDDGGGGGDDGKRNQLVHGDLAGNILFTTTTTPLATADSDTPPPGIIDLSLYWRPVEFAEAIIVADGLLWYHQAAGDDEALVRLVGVEEFRLQMLVRALIFRLVASSDGGRVDEDERRAFEEAVGVLERFLGGSGV
ncbi:hypothetical protein AJ80_04641 [Polytolypa hystricis UAMH7299]|uniref:Aminoglycoside phosphotransferase domain-containing protein n=1 Tax=Polytolypa hystricis (strain UAMH7299) TaxID=1447883 RepID=A0A2B7YAS2_POLH7|nr:hypothetical protein AJ80_04641 [Polytolypa hystricis UAMH7299]